MLCLVHRRSEGWRVDRERHYAAGDDGGGRQCDEPGTIRPSDHTPIDSLVVTGAEANTNGGTDDALGGRDWQGEAGGHNDNEGGA